MAGSRLPSAAVRLPFIEETRARRRADRRRATSKRDGGPTAAREPREDHMLELLEQQKSLTINQWKIFLACFFSLALDFFDFFLISFVLAFFVRDWNLTYGQSALILLSSGVASVPAGYFFAGWATRSAAAKFS